MNKERNEISSEQMKAARSLLRLEQEEIATRAGVSVVTVRRIEAVDGVKQVSLEIFHRVSNVLIEAGAEFIHEGVRKRDTRGDKAQLLADIRAIVDDFARVREASGDTVLSDNDLYDENGLPG